MAPKAALAALPQQRPLGVVGGDAHRAGRWWPELLDAHIRRRSAATVRGGRRPRRAARRRRRRVAGVDELLDGDDAEWSIISMAAGTMPSAMIALTSGRRSATSAKSSSIVRTAGGFWRELAHGDAGGDAEHALAADEGAAQVVAGGVGVEPAEADHRAVGQ
jgi:hypothetical protein